MGVATVSRASITKVCRTRSGRRWPIGSKRGFVFLTSTVASINTCSSGPWRPFVAGTCDQPIANEAIQRRAAYLNGRRHDLYDSRSTWSCSTRRHTSFDAAPGFSGSGQAPREAMRAWLSTDHADALETSSIEPSARSITRRKASRSKSATSVLRACARRGVPILPRARELRPAVVAAAGLTLRHASGLLRLRLRRRVPPGPSAGRRPRRQGPDDEGAAEPDVRVHAAGPVRRSRGVHRLPGMATHPSDRMRRDVQAARHFFNKRVSMVNYVSPETRPEEMLVDDSARSDRPSARRRPDRAGGERPLLRPRAR